MENSLRSKYLKDDNINQECKELIQTLPIEKGMVANHLHQYQGFWQTTQVLQAVLSCQKHFHAHDTDVIVATTPKAGTTWLKALVFALHNRKKYPNTYNINHPLFTTNPHELVPFFEINLYIKKDIVPNLNLLSPPRLFSTHISYESLPKSVKESSCKVVYMCRDPKDTFVSLWYFINKMRPESKGTLPLEVAFDSFCRGVSFAGPFWEHVLGYWKESLENSKKVMFLRYEEMKMNPSLYLKKIAEFLECPFSKEEESKGVIDDIISLCSFEKLSNLEVNKTGKLSTGEENHTYFRRGEVGECKNLLSNEMIERLNIITKKKWVKHGLNYYLNE